MLMERLFNKFEKVVVEFQDKSTVFDKDIIVGVRGLSSNTSNGGSKSYKNCQYLGELAERCEERNLATNIKNLRSMLLAFILETKSTHNEEFLYNQFEIFEEIYMRVSGKDYSLLDEILFKKCKSQISGNDKDFSLNYDLFKKDYFCSSTIEEQSLVLLALSSYKPYIYDEEQARVHYDVFTSLLKTFCCNNINDLELISYVSLSHVYDLIVEQVKLGTLKSFTKKEKDFYKCIRDVATTDLSSVFSQDSLEEYKREVVSFCNHTYSLNKLLELNYTTMLYSSTIELIKKEPTLPSKCRRLGRYFNYFLSINELNMDAINHMYQLYSSQQRVFHAKYLSEYVNLNLISDVYLYAKFFDKVTDHLISRSSISDFVKEATTKESFNNMLGKISKHIIDSFNNGAIDKIADDCEKYFVFNHTLVDLSMDTPIGFQIEYEVDNKLQNTFYFGNAKALMLLKHNCIDKDLNVVVNGNTVMKLEGNDISFLAKAAWELNMFDLCVELINSHEKALLSFRDIFRLSRYSYYSDNLSTLDIINRTLDNLKGSTDYDIVFDIIVTVLIRFYSFDTLKEFYIKYFDDVLRIYNFSKEDEDELATELILDTVNLEKLSFYPNNFLVDKVGIDKAFTLLGISKEDEFKIKSNFINYYSNCSYPSAFAIKCVDLIKGTLSNDELSIISIESHKDYIREAQNSKFLPNLLKLINYFEDNQSSIFKYCTNDLIDMIRVFLRRHNPLQLSTLYIYLKSKNIQELDSALDELHSKILDQCLNN